MLDKFLSLELQAHLLQCARAAIEHGVQHGSSLKPRDSQYLGSLRQDGASFVTLLLNRQLRGCIGSLQAHRPLLEDVMENAYASAFRDPRFSPVREEELPQLQLKISVLTPATLMTFKSEQDLIDQLKPGRDGLVLSDQGHRGTFLPSVWEQLPKPRDFFNHLKRKAGLPVDYWSDTLQVERYHTLEFGEDHV